MNTKDYAEANPVLMSTLAHRVWGAKGEFAVRVRKALEYGDTADQMIVTGDVLDYLSWGAIELMNKEILDKYPDVIISAGNHDTDQKVEGTVEEIYPREMRLEWLREVWPHEIDYTSKVIKDKAMIIQIHNGLGKFNGSQAGQLKQDLATARANGYVVLVFAHIPLEVQRIDSLETDPICNILINNADVVKGIFTGHMHEDSYKEISAKTHDGKDAVIPEYVLTSTAYKGQVLKITVK